VHDSPATETFSVEAKFGRKLVETATDTPARSRILDQLVPPVAEQGSGVEGAFADERLRVDRQPRLAFGAQDVSTMELLMDDDEFALRRDELLNCGHCALDQPPLKRFAQTVTTEEARST